MLNLLIPAITIIAQANQAILVDGAFSLSPWPYAILAVVIFTLLFIVRRYEMGRQSLKMNLEVSRALRAESDVEKRRQDYLEILDTLQDAYVETDHQGIISHVNLPFLKELGYKQREEVQGQLFWYFIQKKFAGDVADKFKILFETGKIPERFETRFHGKDGKRFIGEAALSPVFYQGKLVGTKATIRNNTQRFKAEKDLAVQKDFLDELLQQTPVAVVIMGTDKEISFVNAAFETLFGYGGEEAIGSKLEDLLSAPEIAGDMKECAGYPGEKLFMNSRRRTREGKLIDVEVYAQRFFVGSRNYGHLIFYHDISLRKKAEEVLRMAKDLAERDLEMGREMQTGFFPGEFPEIQDWDAFAYFKAARQVSGDFYDFFPIEGSRNYVLVVADVCDKGVGAALFMVLLRSLIRFYSEQFKEESIPGELVHQIAKKVNDYIVNTHGQSNMFATLVLGILNPDTHIFDYVNGGHDAPVLLDAGGQIKKELPPSGPAFGFSTELAFDVMQLEFEPGDLLLAYTDGLTEAKNLAGEFYGEERMLREMQGAWPSAFSAVKHLEMDLTGHIGVQDQFDDITLVGLRRCLRDEVVSHSFRQKAEMKNLPLFRSFILKACMLMKVDPKISEALQLAIDEVCSNLIIHGYSERAAGEIALSLKQAGDVIQVQIEDQGHPFDPAQFEAPDLSDDIEKRKIGGLGVFMLRELIDEMSYESKDGRNRLSLRKRI